MRGCGFKADGADCGIAPASALLGATPADEWLPTHLRLAVHPQILQQGGANACTAFALGSALRDWLLLHGVVDPGLPAPLWTYRYSRMLEGGGAETLDDGAYFRFCVRALRERGYCEEKYWPYREEEVLVPPPLLAHQHAHDQRQKVRIHRVTDDARKVEIMRLLSRRIPVVMGTTIDAAFFSYASGVWSLRGKPKGAHATEVIGFTPAGVIIRNSWGEEWGPNGFGVVAWDTVEDPEKTADVYAVDAAEDFSEATQ